MIRRRAKLVWRVVEFLVIKTDEASLAASRVEVSRSDRVGSLTMEPESVGNVGSQLVMDLRLAKNALYALLHFVWHLVNLEVTVERARFLTV